MIDYYSMTKETLVGLLEDALEYAEKQDAEVERLNNIINELKKWLKDDNILTFDFTGSINKSEGTLISDEEISKKIEELKGSNDNE